MIIDEILDAKCYNNIINMDYIKEEAELFGYDYITKAIETQDPEETRKALALYIRLNGYNTDIIENELQDVIIKFEEPKKAEQITIDTTKLLNLQGIKYTSLDNLIFYIKGLLYGLSTHNKNYTKEQKRLITTLKDIFECLEA